MQKSHGKCQWPKGDTIMYRRRMLLLHHLFETKSCHCCGAYYSSCVTCVALHFSFCFDLKKWNFSFLALKVSFWSFPNRIPKIPRPKVNPNQPNLTMTKPTQTNSNQPKVNLKFPNRPKVNPN